MEQRQRSDRISIARAVEIYREHCTEHKLPNQKIYRGIGGAEFNYGVVDPSQYVRTSTDEASGNAYTLLIDNLPSWSEYPKRSRSIICTTSEGQASSYGVTYIVIPFDGAKIGVCPDLDIWYSFQRGFKEGLGRMNQSFTLKLFNQSLDFMYQYLKAGTYKESEDPLMISDNSYSQLRSQIQEISENIETIKSRVEEDLADIGRKSITQMFSMLMINGMTRHNGLMNLIKVIFDPETNGFQLEKYKSAFHVGRRSKELWTESRSLLIYNDRYNEFVQELKKEGLA